MATHICTDLNDASVREHNNYILSLLERETDVDEPDRDG